MIIGEIRKIIRNKVFLVMAVAIFITNIFTVLYHVEYRDENYYAYKNEEQVEHLENYEIFINEMEQRGQELLSTFEDQDTSFMARNIEKTEKDYAKLSGLKLDKKYNVGIEEYSNYNYGIFFCIMFAFVVLEYLYLFEKKNEMLNILRTTSNGRWQLIGSKWLVFICMLIGYTVLQELLTFRIFWHIYSIKDMNSPIQSLQIFRDCSYKITMIEGVIFNIVNRTLIATSISSIIFLCGVVFNNVINVLGVPSIILMFQYIAATTISIDSSYDKICSLNYFYSWNMKNYLGVYHNLNFLEYPIEKNIATGIMEGAVILGVVFIGIYIFSVKYQCGYKKYDLLGRFIRTALSKSLHWKNMFINEWYKLLVQQKKWMIIGIFSLIIVSSLEQYIPVKVYETAYEATYHMYLSRISGKIDEATRSFIDEEQNYIEGLKQELENAINSGDEISCTIIGAKLEGREEAYDRLIEQYNKLVKSSDEKMFLVDEMELNAIIHKYDKDVLLFMLGAIVLILCVAGIFASDKENRIAVLSYSTKWGRDKLLKAKVRCCLTLTLFIYLSVEIPCWNGYKNILDLESTGLRLCSLYDPSINSSLSLFEMFILIFGCKFLLYIVLMFITIFMALRSKNEFVTAVTLITITIIGCLIMYFLKLNLSIIVGNLLQM